MINILAYFGKNCKILQREQAEHIARNYRPTYLFSSPCIFAPLHRAVLPYILAVYIPAACPNCHQAIWTGGLGLTWKGQNSKWNHV